jgi:hypothetical protein
MCEYADVRMILGGITQIIGGLHSKGAPWADFLVGLCPPAKIWYFSNSSQGTPGGYGLSMCYLFFKSIREVAAPGLVTFATTK